MQNSNVIIDFENESFRYLSSIEIPLKSDLYRFVKYSYWLFLYNNRKNKDKIEISIHSLFFSLFESNMTDNLSKSLKSTEYELSWANRGLKGNSAADGN
jgi:hypothetical protein